VTPAPPAARGVLLSASMSRSRDPLQPSAFGAARELAVLAHLLRELAQSAGSFDKASALLAGFASTVACRGIADKLVVALLDGSELLRRRSSRMEPSRKWMSDKAKNVSARVRTPALLDCPLGAALGLAVPTSVLERSMRPRRDDSAAG